MDADRVHVFHGTYRNDIAGAVAHGLKLDFLPAGNALLHKHLGNRRKVKTVACDLAQFFGVSRDAAARTAQRIGRTHNDRISDFICNPQRLFHRDRSRRRNDRLPHLFQRSAEALPVLGALDALNIRAEELYPKALQRSVAAELHGKRQPGLSAEPGQQTVRTFLFDDAAERLGGQRLKIDGVRKLFIRHDGGGVGVYQDGADSLLPQHAAGLGAGVIELRRLPDDDRPGADDQDAVYAAVFRHLRPPLRASCAGNGQTGTRYHAVPHRLPDETAP